MLSAPRQDWKAYEEKCQAAHLEWLRSLTDQDTLALYEGFHELAAAHRDDSDGIKRLEVMRWREKLAIRRRMCDAFLELDRLRGGQPRSKDTD